MVVVTQGGKVVRNDTMDAAGAVLAHRGPSGARVPAGGGERAGSSESSVSFRIIATRLNRDASAFHGPSRSAPLWFEMAGGLPPSGGSDPDPFRARYPEPFRVFWDR